MLNIRKRDVPKWLRRSVLFRTIINENLDGINVD